MHDYKQVDIKLYFVTHLLLGIIKSIIWFDFSYFKFYFRTELF